MAISESKRWTEQVVPTWRGLYETWHAHRVLLDLDDSPQAALTQAPESVLPDDSPVCLHARPAVLLGPPCSSAVQTGGRESRCRTTSNTTRWSGASLRSHVRVDPTGATLPKDVRSKLSSSTGSNTGRVNVNNTDLVSDELCRPRSTRHFFASDELWPGSSTQVSECTGVTLVDPLDSDQLHNAVDNTPQHGGPERGPRGFEVAGEFAWLVFGEPGSGT